MSNLYKDLIKLAGDERVEKVVIGVKDGEWGKPEPEYVGKLLSLEEAKAILDYKYDSGYGSADCHPFFAWTKSKVIFVHEYDGATSVVWVPRNPQNIMPDFGSASGER